MASVRCSKNSIDRIYKWVAACLFAATLILWSGADSFAYTVSAVEGLTEWQAPVAQRSLNAVLGKISSSANSDSVQNLLKIVSDRLFSGYQAKGVSIVSEDIIVELAPVSEPPAWTIAFEAPKLSAPPAEWLGSDLAAAEKVLSGVLDNVPVDSLSWCDVALRDKITEKLSPVLPGWKPSFIVHADSGSAELRISFSPEMPLLLAVNTNFTSNTLPTLINSELKHDMLGEFAPFVGLPVMWAKAHSKDMNRWAEGFLSSQDLINRTASSPKVNFVAAPVSQMNVAVESSHYNLWAWAAVYAGTKERSAELGVHLGRRTEIVRNWYMEFYGEGILELKNWNTEGRLGMRWSPWGDVWLGGEWSSKDSMWWGRLSIDPRLHKPYAWIRVREDGKINTAIGWKATEHLSLELHYDDRDEDRWSLRMLGNL